MSHQIRPGARGGRDQFSWDQVKEDKQRSNYLGSSIHGLPDKFKKGPETFWYAKETKTIPEKKSDKSEIEILKEKEKLAMEALLGGNLKKKRPEIQVNERREEPERCRRDHSPDRSDRRDERDRNYDRYNDQRDYRSNKRYHDDYDRKYRENNRRERNERNSTFLRRRSRSP